MCRPQTNIVTLTKYLVPLYAPDENQILWEWVAAETPEQATGIAAKQRAGDGDPFTYGGEPFTAAELRLMAQNLSQATLYQVEFTCPKGHVFERNRLLAKLDDLMPFYCPICADEIGTAHKCEVTDNRQLSLHEPLPVERDSDGTDICGECDCQSDEVQSTYCGSLCPDCLAEHCKACEVCAKDFACY